MPSAPRKAVAKKSVAPPSAPAAEPLGGADASTSEPSVPLFADAYSVKLQGWRPETVERAARSLSKYIGERKSAAKDLFDDDEIIFLQIALKRMPTVPGSNKPVRLPLPHPIYTLDTTEVCLIVKDIKGEGHKDAKKRVALMDKHAGIAKVVGVNKLRTKYESYESKRALCKAYDLFLADERVLPSLPKLIGKEFFVKKKQPVPIKITGSDWSAQVSKARNATYMFITSGTSINIRIARSSFEPAQVAANVYAALVAAMEKIPKKWANVSGVFLKSADSVALPLFQSLPTAVIRIPDAAEAAGAAEEPSLKGGKRKGAAAGGKKAPKAAGPKASKVEGGGC